MNKSRKLLTVCALAIFVVVLFVIGNNQSPYQDMQIEWGRGRVWGLTPLGNALSILIVIYIGLFALLTDDRFLIRWRRALIRVALGLIVLGLIATGLAIRTWAIQRAAERARVAAELAEQEAKSKTAHIYWRQLIPRDRGWIKWAIKNNKSGPEREHERLNNLRNFVAEVWEPETNEELTQEREIAVQHWNALTPKKRGIVKMAIECHCDPTRGIDGSSSFTEEDGGNMAEAERFIPEALEKVTDEELGIPARSR